MVAFTLELFVPREDTGGGWVPESIWTLWSTANLQICKYISLVVQPAA